jgi:hypothetical protein
MKAFIILPWPKVQTLPAPKPTGTTLVWFSKSKFYVALERK